MLEIPVGLLGVGIRRSRRCHAGAALLGIVQAIAVDGTLSTSLVFRP
jgi:hypothetical protein